MVLLKLYCRCGEPLLILGRSTSGDSAVVLYSPHRMGLAITQCPSCGAQLLIGRAAPLPARAPEATRDGRDSDARLPSTPEST
jgi:hypothetical protein